MSKYIQWIVLGFLTCFLCPSHAALYKLDPAHTEVLYRIKHLGFSTPTGKWMANGTLEFDKDKPAQSKVNVVIQMKDMITGNPELDKHLKGMQFFDVERFPTATFVSDKVVLKKGQSADVEGKLTLLGVTKPVILHVVFNKEGPNPVTGTTTVGFSAQTKIKRSDFGNETLAPLLGDEVILDIEAEGSLEK